jgi:5-methylcytosine-specific restriction endonuclease McrA
MYRDSNIKPEDKGTRLIERWRWITVVCIDCGRTFEKRSTARKTRRCPDCVQTQRAYRRDGHKISTEFTRLWRARGKQCEICGAPGEETHHKVRLADGGSYDESNLIFLCGSCHDRQHYSQPRMDRWFK